MPTLITRKAPLCWKITFIYNEKHPNFNRLVIPTAQMMDSSNDRALFSALSFSKDCLATQLEGDTRLHQTHHYLAKFLFFLLKPPRFDWTGGLKHVSYVVNDGSASSSSRLKYSVFSLTR
jgi:hypothetical protein